MRCTRLGSAVLRRINITRQEDIKDPAISLGHSGGSEAKTWVTKHGQHIGNRMAKTWVTVLRSPRDGKGLRKHIITARVD